MKKTPPCNRKERFCRAYLQTMDPQRAAQVAGCRDGYGLLKEQRVCARLEEMRAACTAQILREDAIRRLSELAFGRANDAVALALAPQQEQDRIGELDLSAVAEFKVSDKGGVEIKFLDRVRALETLCAMLDGRCDLGAESFFQALEEAGTEELQP